MHATRTARTLAVLFVIYATITLVLAATLMPPFQHADELNHANRAYQIGDGVLFAERFADGSGAGGRVPAGLASLAAPFEPLRFHPHVQVDPAMQQAGRAAGWGRVERSPFPNTAIYPPAFYLPASLGLRFGQLAGLSVRHAMILARISTGIASLALAGAAILLSAEFAPLLFAVLCLPMSLALFAAISQDGPMIGCAALGGVLLARPRTLRHGFGLGCALLALVVMARPPYLPLCLAPLLTPGRALTARATGAGCILLSGLCWSLASSHLVMPLGASQHIAEQIAAIRHDPHLLRLLLHTTLHDELANGFPVGREFIGVLGWLDTTLPNPYYALAGCVLLLALLMSASPEQKLTPARASLAVLMLPGSVCMIYLLQYLSWSRIGGGVVEGVQGRYFLPLAPLLILAMPARRWNAPRTLRLGLAVFPLLSVAVTLRAILVRYYLG